mgnify:CR=1 FL=1
MKSLYNPALVIIICWTHRNLLAQIFRRSLATRYKGATLGLVWTIAYPLMMLSVYTFVFGVIFKPQWGNMTSGSEQIFFPLFLFAGLSVYNIFLFFFGSSPSLILNNPSYVKKVVFPLELLPICHVLTAFCFGSVWIALMLLGITWLGGTISIYVLFLPFPLFTLLLLTMGLSFILSSLGVYLRDAQHLVTIVIQIFSFISPIFYPLSSVPAKLRWILLGNPLTYIIEQVREICLYGRMFDWTVYFYTTLAALLFFQLGLVWFIKTKKGFADVI